MKRCYKVNDSHFLLFYFSFLLFSFVKHVYRERTIFHAVSRSRVINRDRTRIDRLRKKKKGKNMIIRIYISAILRNKHIQGVRSYMFEQIYREWLKLQEKNLHGFWVIYKVHVKNVFSFIFDFFELWRSSFFFPMDIYNFFFFLIFI